MLTEKCSLNLKVESYACSVGIFRTSSPGGSIPRSTERTALQEAGGGVWLYRTLQQSRLIL